ncbi:MAG TPA: hypothetical protein PK103_01560 [Elusimicrobiales bacterium]|nr:hypothetical protein [Elusimicrobiales bacterium]HOL62032.1 hypothetical protein [Elusimicrobiales bacterium]
MKIKLFFLVWIGVMPVLNAQDNVSTQSVLSVEQVKVRPVVDVKNKEYINAKEFDDILREAEHKLKMDKSQNKNLRDYVFELLPKKIKKDMYPHEKFETTNFLLELKENQPELTIKLFSKEIEINKANPYAYYERAGVYLKGCFAKVDKKACENAIKDLNESLKYVKNDTETTIDGLPFRWSIYEMLGRIYSYSETDINDFNKGLFYFTKNINADTSKPSISYYDRAKVYLKLDKFEQAIKDLSEYKKSTMQFEDEKKTIL